MRASRVVVARRSTDARGDAEFASTRAREPRGASRATRARGEFAFGWDAATMRGAPPSPSWYGARAACATRGGDLVYASDKAVCVLDGATGAVRGLVGTKARALAVCAATTSETRRGRGRRREEARARSSCAGARIRF